MTLIDIGPFEGRIPALSAKLLGNNQAQTAENCKTEGGQLQPIKDLSLIANAGGLIVVDSNADEVVDTASAATVITAGQGKTIFFLVDSWLNWDTVVDVVKSFLGDDRIYYTGDGRPKQTDHTLATSGAEHTWPTDSYRLGVPAPATKLTATVDGTGDGNVERSTAYVYTYVTGWGEESAPSPPSDVVDVEGGEHIDLSGFVNNTDSDLNITHVRLYRVASGTEMAEYQLVPYKDDNIADYSDTASYTIGDLVKYTDDKVYEALQTFAQPPEHNPTDIAYWEETVEDGPIADVVASGFIDERPDSCLSEVIATTGWIEPDQSLAGLTLVASGVMAGFVYNEVHFCEPGYPYAWPTAYQLTFPDDVVAIGSYMGYTIVLTEGQPWEIVGCSDPATAQARPMPYQRPCRAKTGVSSSKFGVAYPTDDGIFVISSSGGNLITKDLFTKEQWEALNIDDILSFTYESYLIVFFDDTPDGFLIDLLQPPRVFDISLTGRRIRSGHQTGGSLYLLSAEQTGSTYSIYKWKGASTYIDYTWESKIFQLPFLLNFAYARVISNNSGDLDFKLYCDNVLKHTEAITDDNIFPLPSGFMAREFEVELDGAQKVDGVQLANSIEEMAGG